MIDFLIELFLIKLFLKLRRIRLEILLNLRLVLRIDLILGILIRRIRLVILL